MPVMLDVTAQVVIILTILTNGKNGCISSGSVWTFALFKTVMCSHSLFQQSSTLFEVVLYFMLLLSTSFADYIDSDEHVHPREIASFPSRLSFWYVIPLARLAAKRTLTTDDIWKLSTEDQANSLSSDFIKIWKEESKKKRRFISITIITIVKTYKGLLFWGSFIRLIENFLMACSPLVLKALMRFMANKEDPLSHGIEIVVMMFFVELLWAVISASRMHFTTNSGLRMRSALTSMIYQKASRLKNKERQKTSVGNIVNLMSSDVEAIRDLTSWYDALWSCPLQISFTMYFIFQELGIAAFGGIVIMIALILLNAQVHKWSGTLQEKRITVSDDRIKIINEVLFAIKVIKVYAWEKHFMKVIGELRSLEMKYITSISYSRTLLRLLDTMQPILVSVVSFAFFLILEEDNSLTLEKSFVSLACFSLLRNPLRLFPDMIRSAVNASVAAKRIDRYLLSEELENYVEMSGSNDNAVSYKRASFKWEETRETLKDVSFDIKTGSLTAIVGIVGSGKSSLLSAILGEIDKTSGSISLGSSVKSIGYVPQEAWIKNDTIKENIIFGSPFNADRFKRVVEYCQLGSDLNFLTEGAETEIGERGINLSGGQKQRINLSRAVYSDADLFLLDDPFSAVDANVGKKLFQEVLSSDTGILKDKTRIVVTNNQGILPSFDNIIVLNNGTVSAVGSYEYLLQTNCEFVKHFSVKPSQEENRHTKVAEKNVNKEARKLLKKSLQEEEITNGKLSSLLSLSFLPKNYFVLFVLGHVATQLLRGASNYWLSVPSELKTINKLGWMSIYAWLGIFQGFSVFFSSTYLTKCILEISTKLHENFLARLLCSPMSFFETTPSGRVINRFSNDMNIVDEILAQTLSHLVQRFMELAASILTIVAVIPSFLFITVPVSFLYYLIQRLYTPVCHQVRRLYSTTSSPIFLLLNEALSGVSTVRAYGAERRFAEEFERRIDMNIGCYNVILAANRWLAVGLQFCGTVFVSSVALIAVIKRDSVNPALIGLALSYTANIKQILEMCVRESADIGNNVSAVERIAQYSDFPRESVWKGARDLTNWPQKGRIDFEDYSTTYRRGLKNVLENISFTIYPREKIGVVGRTGAGKSSLSMALFRILESTEGCIKIDDIDISSIGLHDLRSKITVMPQEPVLFTGTIRSNIDPFNEKSDQELWEVLEQSNLRNFIKDLKQGLQTHVFEGGDNFSVGQKQMICLSRALLRKSKILVLDEATAAVDMETDSMIQQTIRSSLFIDSTVITIAHRIHTIMKSDRILVLDKGKVAEFDKPNTLLADPSSLFSQLYRSAAFAENFF